MPTSDTNLDRNSASSAESLKFVEEQKMIKTSKEEHKEQNYEMVVDTKEEAIQDEEDVTKLCRYYGVKMVDLSMLLISDISSSV